MGESSTTDMANDSLQDGYSSCHDCIWSTQCLKNRLVTFYKWDMIDWDVLFLQRKRGLEFIFNFSQNMSNLVPGFSLKNSGLDIIGAADVSRAQDVEPAWALWRLRHNLRLSLMIVHTWVNNLDLSTNFMHIRDNQNCKSKLEARNFSSIRTMLRTEVIMFCMLGSSARWVWCCHTLLIYLFIYHLRFQDRVSL